MQNSLRPPRFLKPYRTLSEALEDRHLAALGDAYVNFIYSLALSTKKGKPEGKKVKGSMLAEALRKAKLRKFLPSRIDRHVLSDAAEALIVYAWLHSLLTLEESVQTLVRTSNSQEGLTQLLEKAEEQIRLSKLFEVPR